MEQLEFMINGGETKRFHTWPVLREQRVDSHSWGVALLYSLMAGGDGTPETGGITVPGLMLALTHDMAEHKVGDLPAPTKRELGLREQWGALEDKLLSEVGWLWEPMCSDYDKRWVKLADAMDGALYCIRERMMGNKTISVPFNNFRKYIRELATEPKFPSRVTEWEIIEYIDDMWEQANG